MSHYTVGYSWELGLGYFPPWQRLLPGKHATPHDCHLHNEVLPYAARAKCERVATYRQIQGYAAQIHWVTAGNVRFEDFDRPPGCHLDPVQQGEFREAVDEGDRTYVEIVKPSGVLV